jgi:aminopeptidase
VLVQAVYEEVLRAGGLPIMQLSTDGAAPAFYELASDAQLDWIPPTAQWVADNADVRIAIMADTNARELSQVDPKRQARVQKARKPLLDAAMRRSAAGEYRWCLTLFPTNAYASEAGMSLARYEDLFYSACLANDPDPVTAWARQSDEVKRLAEWMQGKEEVHVKGPGTDIRLGVAERTFIPCFGDHNMPDGEFFTGPVEDAVDGEVAFTFPAVYGGREVSGVRFKFEGGRIVDASAQQGEEFLIEMLDTDDGARRLGELGIGCNPGIQRFMKNVGFDEKIDGTIHLAVGNSYTFTGGRNVSAVHWDIVKDLRSGGRLYADGRLVQEAGRWLLDGAG